MQTALERGDSERASALVHTLKGVSATIGAMSLALTVSELEQTIKDGIEDAHSLLFTTLEQQLAELFESMDVLCGTPLYSEADDIMRLPKEELEALLKSLHESLLNNSLGARKLAEQLKGHISILEWEELYKLIARLDYEKAASLLERTGKMCGYDLTGVK